jgi:hypothetical protein
VAAFSHETDHHSGGRETHAEACDHGEGRRQAERPEQCGEGPACDQHLQAAKTEDIARLGPDPPQREMQAQIEQQEHHARFGHRGDHRSAYAISDAEARDGQPQTEIADDRVEPQRAARQRRCYPEPQQGNRRLDGRQHRMRV